MPATLNSFGVDRSWRTATLSSSASHDDIGEGPADIDPGAVERRPTSLFPRKMVSSSTCKKIGGGGKALHRSQPIEQHFGSFRVLASE